MRDFLDFEQLMEEEEEQHENQFALSTAQRLAEFSMEILHFLVHCFNKKKNCY